MPADILALRKYRGEKIASMKNQITRLHDYEYLVNSQTVEGKQYRVFHDMDGWSCSCPDYSHRLLTCKHIHGVRIQYHLHEEVKQNVAVISPIADVSTCRFCGSQKLKKAGLRHNVSGDIQRYECLDCHRSFSLNIGFEKMKHNPQAVTTAMQLYFSGESLRHTQKSLELLGVKVSHRTVLNWIRKYVSLMEKYLDKITPKVSDVWRADEVYVKFKGNMKYVFALMDDETRFWIAKEVADTKYTHDARHLFAMGREIAGRKPATLVTDGLPAYAEAFRKEYGVPSNRAAQPQHIREIQLDGRVHNNKMERMNGELRDREKVMRGLKNVDTPILTGYQLFHNYIRPHEGLKGKTPADMVGIKVEGENKWKTLIENASQDAQLPSLHREKISK